MLSNSGILEIPNKKIIRANEKGGYKFPIGDINKFADKFSIDELFSGVDIRCRINNWENARKRNQYDELWWDGKDLQKITLSQQKSHLED